MEMILVRPQMTTYTALRADSVSALREWLQDLPGVPETPLLSINTPCGETVEYQAANDAPTVDTPCPCGRPDHWLVQVVASE